MIGKPIAFSFSKKAEPKRVVESLAKPKRDERESIVGLEGGQVTIDMPKAALSLRKIPCKNPLNAQSRSQPALAKQQGPKDQETPQKDMDQLPGGLISQNISKLSTEDAEAARELLKDSASVDGEVKAMALPILMREGSKRARVGNDPDASKDMFDSVPVEAFGEAMLRGMGYDPNKHTTQPVYHNKPHDNLLGLGAKALLPHEKALLASKKGNKGAAAVAPKSGPANTQSEQKQPNSQDEHLVAKACRASDGCADDQLIDNMGKRRRIEEVGSNATGDLERAKDGPSQAKPELNCDATNVNEIWPTRGLVVRFIGTDKKLSDFYGVEAVVLDVDAEQYCCRIKARVAGKTQVLPGVHIRDLETRVGRNCDMLRVVRGPQKGCVAKCLERDVKNNVARVNIQGTESSISLDHLCQFVV